MKSNNKKNAVPLRSMVRFISLMIFFFILMGCSEEGTSTTRDFDVDDLVGNVKETTWILKSAVLDTPFDPDGDGPMLPLSDIKPLIFQMFHFFDNCSSVEEIPIQFKQGVGGSLFFPSVYFSFFIALLSSKDFIWVMATLLSSISRSFCDSLCRISNAFMLSILLRTTSCSKVA